MKADLALGKIERVKVALREAARQFPLHGRLHAELARELIRHKQYDLALAEYLRFEESGERNPDAMLGLAFLEAASGAYSDAIRHSVAILEQQDVPEKLRGAAAALAGLSCESLGRRPEAVRHLRLAIELAPSQENSYLALAQIYEKEERYTDAVRLLEQGRSHFPDSPGLLLALGSNLVAGGDYQAGSQVLKELIQRFPDQFEAYPKLAEAYRKMGNPASATDVLKKLARRKPDYPMLHTMIAQSMLEQSPVDYSGVLAELQEAERKSPDDFEVYYLRGKALLSLGKNREAVTALQRAIELRPTEASARYQLAVAYRKLGKTALAREEFQRVEHLRLSPAELR